MQVDELLVGLDREIAQSEQAISDLQTWLATEQQRLTDLRLEAKAVRSAVQRLSGGETPGSGTPDTTWVGLTAVDAVERSLREAGPLHLQEIADLLVSKGRERLHKEAISANLTHLKQKRGSVTNIGQGRWDYLRPAPALRVVGDSTVT